MVKNSFIAFSINIKPAFGGTAPAFYAPWRLPEYCFPDIAYRSFFGQDSSFLAHSANRCHGTPKPMRDSLILSIRIGVNSAARHSAPAEELEAAAF